MATTLDKPTRDWSCTSSHKFEIDFFLLFPNQRADSALYVSYLQASVAL